MLKFFIETLNSAFFSMCAIIGQYFYIINRDNSILFAMLAYCSMTLWLKGGISKTVKCFFALKTPILYQLLA